MRTKSNGSREVVSTCTMGQEQSAVSEIFFFFCGCNMAVAVAVCGVVVWLCLCLQLFSERRVSGFGWGCEFVRCGENEAGFLETSRGAIVITGQGLDNLKGVQRV